MTALQASSCLTALADPTRQRIIEMLAAGAMSSGEIAGRFKLSPPAISQHRRFRHYRVPISPHAGHHARHVVAEVHAFRRRQDFVTVSVRSRAMPGATRAAL